MASTTATAAGAMPLCGSAPDPGQASVARSVGREHADRPDQQRRRCRVTWVGAIAMGLDTGGSVWFLLATWNDAGFWDRSG